jgi:uncharacterized protein (DUF1800 family)
MAYPRDPLIEHLLRRAGFGARLDELDTYRAQSYTGAVNRLLDYDRIPDDVDGKIGKPGYALVTPALRGGVFSPRTNIADARQRWLFRMLHSNRPLQEKMTLFWHNHFATAYTKIQRVTNSVDATRFLAAKASEDPAGVRGQMEMLRDNALGNFRDILVNIAKDTAMLLWLDGYLNTRNRPQENFGREIMELFTMGVGFYTEPDVYAAARVFTGWNFAPQARVGAEVGMQRLDFQFNPNQHDAGSKTFSFAIYPDGTKTIPARTAANGLQDGLDFIEGLAAHPETGRYLARKLYRFFVSETSDIPQRWVDDVAAVYRRGYNMKDVMRAVLMSNEFWDDRNYFTRYAWPAEFVVRTLKDVGWSGFSLSDSLVPLTNMGQNLYDPPDVAGWDLGRSWFSTGSMLARMNFAALIASNQRVNLRNAAKAFVSTPESLLSFVFESLRTPAFDRAILGELESYLRATGAWTGSTTQIENKVAGLVHLVAGTPEYQFV